MTGFSLSSGSSIRKGRFIQYYRENAKYLERTHGFVQRLGIEKLRTIVVEDSEGIAASPKTITILRRHCLYFHDEIRSNQQDSAGEGRVYSVNGEDIAVFRTRRRRVRIAAHRLRMAW